MLHNEIITVSLKVIGIWKVGAFIEMVELSQSGTNVESIVEWKEFLFCRNNVGNASLGTINVNRK